MFRTASSRRGSKAKKSSQPTPDAEEAGGDFDGAEDEADVQDRSGFDRIAGELVMSFRTWLLCFLFSATAVKVVEPAFLFRVSLPGKCSCRYGRSDLPQVTALSKVVFPAYVFGARNSFPVTLKVEGSV